VQFCAAQPARVDLVSSGERFVLVHLQEGARAFSLRVFDCRERLFDELTTGNFLASEKMRKVVNAHHIEFAPRPALRESRIETPERPPVSAKAPSRAESCKKFRRCLSMTFPPLCKERASFEIDVDHAVGLADCRNRRCCRVRRTGNQANSSSSAFASFRSRVSKPSVNHP